MPATKRAMDFTNVKDAGRFAPRHRPAGDYLMKIIAVDDHTSNKDNEGWVFTCVVSNEARNARPATYPYYCNADEKNAWKVRKLFVACGKPVPKKRVMVDPNKLVNAEFGAVLDDDEYEGRMRSAIVDVFPAEDMDDSPADDQYDDDVDDEEEAPPPRKKAAAKTTRRRAPEPDDDDEEAPPRRRATKSTTATKRRRPPVDEDDDDDDVDELDLDEL